MTTVVAIERVGGVTFASDSQVTLGGRAAGQTAKVVRNGGTAFGITGRLRTTNVLAHAELPVYDPEEAGPVDKWLTRELIPAMKKALTEAQTLEIDKGLVDVNGMMLVSVAGRVYYIGDDFGWWRPDDGNYAVGSGAQYALGALHAGATPEQAVAAAAYYDVYTSGETSVIKL